MGTNLINEELRDCLLFDINLVFAKDLLSFIPLLTVKSCADSLDVCPIRVSPFGAENESILNRMEVKTYIPVVKKAQIR